MEQPEMALMERFRAANLLGQQLVRKQACDFSKLVKSVSQRLVPPKDWSCLLPHCRASLGIWAIDQGRDLCSHLGFRIHMVDYWCHSVTQPLSPPTHPPLTPYVPIRL